MNANNRRSQLPKKGENVCSRFPFDEIMDLRFAFLPHRCRRRWDILVFIHSESHIAILKFYIDGGGDNNLISFMKSEYRSPLLRSRLQLRLFIVLKLPPKKNKIFLVLVGCPHPFTCISLFFSPNSHHKSCYDLIKLTFSS